MIAQVKHRPAMDLAVHWDEFAHEHQKPPEGDWTTWLLLGGRGAGKTRAGAEWIRALAEARPGEGAARRIALVAESYADAREIMIEGQSGIKACARRDFAPAFEASRRRLVWPDAGGEPGAVAYCFSAEDPDGLRGFQFDAAWCDELAKWRYAEETWSNLQLALRIGDRPRQMVTTTPRPTALLKRIHAAKTTKRSHASTFGNKPYLSSVFFSEIAAQYEGTALGRQELYGEIVENIEGALWTWNMIEAARISLAPDLTRVVVAIDPPAGGAGANAGECGIVVAGRAPHDGGDKAYVLADWSVRGLSPRGWAERAVAAYHEFAADRIVVEVNQGGDMARAVIEQIDPCVPIRDVRATHGKRLRAEPVAALYERGAVRHVGAFPKLEDQMTSFTGIGGASPDRLDALVWAISDLMLRKESASPLVRRI